jgi:lantibiotic modifying enzyme
MTECLTIFPGTDLNLATGIAGQGLSVLHCLPWLEANDAEKILEQGVTQLLDRQEKDGSWKQTKTGIQEKGIKLPGFSYGIAGITYFLLEYAVRFNSEPAKCAAVKALDWLIRQRHRKGDFRIWYVNPHTKTEDPWLDHGFSGITLVFIKAFELLKDIRYKAVVDSALLIHPEKLSGNYLMLSSGITGLGEIYLEAYRVFREDIWLKRAGWIAGFLIHTALEQPDGSVYWLADYDTNPTADLMVGNAGLIHFLMRYQHPDVLGFPIFGLK